MNRKEIPPTEFFQCIHELMTKSIPLLAVFVANDGAIAKLYGFADSATHEMGLIFSSNQGTLRFVHCWCSDCGRMQVLS
jgi:hypothetical protein